MKRLLVALPLALAGALWFYWLALPWPFLVRSGDPAPTALMRQRAAAADRPLEQRHTYVPLQRISSHLRRAVIVAEDGRFYQHGGVDWDALREEFRYEGDDSFSLLDPGDWRALHGSWRYYRANRERIRGRSTITQQVAKNLWLSADRSPLRKVEELIVARRLERFLSKDRILEIYLNVAEWGPGLFGAEAAAQHYFGRSAAALTPAQAAALAATLPHPLTSNPAHRPARMQWRQQLILSRMGGTGPVETVPLGDDERDAAPPAEAEPLPRGLLPPDTTQAAPPAPDTARRPAADTVRPPPDTAAGGLRLPRRLP
jgi:monofunctional glycosyltransferase